MTTENGVIPEDVRATAQYVADDIRLSVDGNGFCDREKIEGTVVRAIMAERERWVIQAEFLENSTAAVSEAVDAERKRCEEIASERVGSLFTGAQAIPSDGQFAIQMVEAMLIWQRIASGYVAKEPVSLEYLRPKRTDSNSVVLEPTHDH